jgi:site-specific recombinase XerD
MPDTRPSAQGKPLLERLRHHIRMLHYSIRTEEAYVSHVRRFILFHQKRHPAQMGAEEIRQYLSHLASDDGVAASTQNQAASAILFLYREVLAVEMGYVAGVERAKRPARVPTVQTRAEVSRLLEGLRDRRRAANGCPSRLHLLRLSVELAQPLTATTGCLIYRSVGRVMS